MRVRGSFDAEADDEPPIVTITAPVDGQELEPGSLVSIVIDAQDEGWGVSEVWIEIEGMEQPVRDAYPPYGFADIPFPEGVFEIVAFASDWAGHVGMSEPVRIGVGEPVPEDPPAADSTGADGSGGGDVGDSTGAAGSTSEASEGSTGPAASGDDGGGGSGCACRSTRGSDSGGPACVLLLLLALVRRRCQ